MCSYEALRLDAALTLMMGVLLSEVPLAHEVGSEHTRNNQEDVLRVKLLGRVWREGSEAKQDDAR